MISLFAFIITRFMVFKSIIYFINLQIIVIQGDIQYVLGQEEAGGGEEEEGDAKDAAAD